MSTDEELREAVKIAASLKPPILRVHIEVIVEGTKQQLGETSVATETGAAPDALGESARNVLAALDIPVDDAVRSSSSFLVVGTHLSRGMKFSLAIQLSSTCPERGTVLATSERLFCCRSTSCR